MNKHLLVRLAFLILLIMNAGLSVYAEEAPSLGDLLGRYEKSLELWNRIHFRVRQEEQIRDSDLSDTAVYVMQEDVSRKGELFDCRSQFGYSSPPLNRKTSRFVWDGRRSLNFWPGANIFDGSLAVTEDSTVYRRIVDFASIGSLLWGGLKGNNTPILSLLRSSERVGIEKQMNAADGSRCYVVTANTPAGKFRLWFNPERGCQVGKAEVSKVAADSYYGVPMSAAPPVYPRSIFDEWPMGVPRPATTPMVEFEFRMEVLKFGEVDGHWIPVGIKWESRIRYENDRVLSTSAAIEVSGVDLNPDFEAIGAFHLKVPNGAAVIVTGENHKPFAWKDGKIVPKEDKPSTTFRPLLDFGTVQARP